MDWRIEHCSIWTISNRAIGWTFAHRPAAVNDLFPNNQAKNQSFRMIVHPTIGGERLRIRLSNLMGDRPIRLEPVRIAKRLLGPAIIAASEVPLTWNGSASVEIAPGTEAVSDPVDFSLAVGDDLAISFHLVGDSGPITWHAVSLNINYVGLPNFGDTTTDVLGLSFAQVSPGWFFVSGVDVLAPESPGTIVMIGDSITDGTYQFPETNTRWPDLFARRLRARGIQMGVLNQGINSNTVSAEGVSPDSKFQGPPAVERFQRDVLDRPGVRSIVIFEGTNDLSANVEPEAVYAGISDMIDQAQAAGICVVLGTIMPRGDFGLRPDATAIEAKRQALNALLRNDPRVEGIADFDLAMRNSLWPSQPNYLYYAPDTVHPTSIGFLAMANAVPIEALVPPPIGHCQRGT